MTREFSPVRKLFKDATHRSRSPSATLAAFEPLMPRLGITRLANITGLDCTGIPVYVAVRPLSRGLATSQGKGIDKAAAKASALMEAIETWHAERIETLTRCDTFEHLRQRGEALDATQLQCRPGRDPRTSGPIAWIQAHELMADRPCWVPLESVSCDFSSAVVRQALFLQTTNGLASGNEWLEAVIHGLCEAIERDAVTCSQLSPDEVQAGTRIDPALISDASCNALLEQLAQMDIECAVWDCTSDIGIPVFSAMIVDSPTARRWRTRGPFRGYGCHPCREIAFLRAVTEAAQSRVTYISGSRDDLFPRRYRSLRRMEEKHTVGRQLSHPATRPFDEVPSIDNDTFNADLELILERLGNAGLNEVAVFDLTRQDVGVPVVKVLVPGLENDIHRDPHYRPGRRARAALRATA